MEQLAISEDVFDCYYWEAASGFLWIKVRGTIKHPTMYREVAYNKSLSDSECQKCQE